MENETRFDLNAAISDWQQELATQMEISADDRRELTSHLRDSLAQLARIGLSEEEAFYLARRRVGAPAKLADEFAKTSFGGAWREKALWAAVGLFGYNIWQSFSGGIGEVCLFRFYIDWSQAHPGQSANVNSLMMLLGIMLTIACFLIFVIGYIYFAKGRMQNNLRILDVLSKSRARVFFAGCILIGISSLYWLGQPGTIGSSQIVHIFIDLLIQFTFLTLICWLMPVERPIHKPLTPNL